MSSKIRKRTWEESFAALQRYKDEHGNCLVPIHSYHEDSALGGWVNHQRSKKCKLTADQHRRLTDLGFVWSVRMRNKQWNEMLDRLRAYKESHNGDANVPEHWPEDQALADFCEEQRKKHRRGQLSSNRQKQLMDIGLQLKAEAAGGDDDDHIMADQEEHEKEEEEEEDGGGDDDCHIQYDMYFDQQYQKLVDFHVMEGHCDIPVESHELGLWVTTLRQTYKDNPATSVSSECFELLEELGFDWDGPILAQGATGEVKDEQKSPAPEGTGSGIEEPDSIVEETTGKKPENAITKKTKGVTADNTKATIAIPEVTAGSRAEKQDNQGVGSSDNDAHVDSSTDDEDGQDEDDSHENEQNDSGGSSESGSGDDDTDMDDDDDEDDDDESGVGPAALSRITNGLLKRRKPSLPIKKGRLTTRMSRSLPTNHSAAAGKTSVRRPSLNCPSRDERFMKQFQSLLEFKRTHGHTRVPQNRKYKTLGGWVNNLRVQYKRDPENGVRPDRVKLLNDAGFVWNATADMPSYDVRWEQQFEKLLDFKREFSHCRVPQTGPHRRLGRWVATQRALYAKDPEHGIRADRLKRLQDVEFTWDAKGFKGKHFYTNLHDEEETAMAADASATESDGDEEDEDHDECDDGNYASVEAVEAEAVPNIDEGTAVAVAVAVPDDQEHHSSGAVAPVADVKDDATEKDRDWNEYYTKLVEFHKVHKHCRIRSGYDAGLAKWVKLQRQQGKKNPNPRRLELLRELGFCLDAKREQRQSVNDSRWEHLYHQLVTFKEEYGHCRVPQNGGNKKLGKWVATQRLLHNKDPDDGIRPDRFRLLNDLGFTWNAKEFRSRRRFSSPTVAKTPDLAEEGRREDDDQPCSSIISKLFSLSKAAAEVCVGDEEANKKPMAFGSTDGAPSSCRIQPLVSRLCDLIDQDSVHPNQISKGAYIETCKRSLECMIDETKGRVDCCNVPAKRKDPPATSIVKLEP